MGGSSWGAAPGTHPVGGSSALAGDAVRPARSAVRSLTPRTSTTDRKDLSDTDLRKLSKGEKKTLPKFFF